MIWFSLAERAEQGNRADWQNIRDQVVVVQFLFPTVYLKECLYLDNRIPALRIKQVTLTFIGRCLYTSLYAASQSK